MIFLLLHQASFDQILYILYSDFLLLHSVKDYYTSVKVGFIAVASLAVFELCSMAFSYFHVHHVN
jgi:hypothetical protein